VKLLSEFYQQKKESKKKGKWTYYNPECKECTKARSRKNQLKNHDKYIKYIRRYHKKNKEYEDKQKRGWREKNKKRLREYVSRYQKEHPDKIRKYNLKRQQNKMHEISKEEWEYCKEFFSYSCAYCGIALEDHMNLHGQDLHKEHVDCEGSNKIDNCVPACKSCNSAKWQYSLEEWYMEANPIYNHERLEKIHNWLNNNKEI